MKTIVITGASSGIGEALAREYAAPGHRLCLCARNPERLEQVAAACRTKGADVIVRALDVCKRKELGAWLSDIEAVSPIDLLVANAGVIAGATETDPIEDEEAGYRLLETNILGVANTIHPVLRSMVARRNGQIAIMSSIAAFVPVPHAASYGASKAALFNYGRSLRDALRPFNVRVSVICPGYIDTGMSRMEQGPKPFLMDATKAAKSIAKGLARDRGVILFPLLFGILTWISGILPSPIRRAASAPFRFTIRK